MRGFTVHSPARVCLYGDHQDYLALPVIAGAIDRYMEFQVSHCSKNNIVLELVDLGETIQINIDPTNEYPSTDRLDFFRSGLRVAARHGYLAKQGLKVRIHSNIPINAGVSSSSALVVGWIYTLAFAFGTGSIPDPNKLGQMAFEAEVIEHNSPGGQMDQYTIAHGGLVHIQTGAQIRVESLHTTGLTMVLADSKIKKETLSTIGSVREFTTQAVAQIQESDRNFSLINARINTLENVLKSLSPNLRSYAEAAVRNHELTLAALGELNGDNPDMTKLGHLMSAHHHQLSQVLNVSHEQIDRWITVGLQHGAYGAKIVGSGHGGCSIFLVPEHQENTLSAILLEAGVPAAYPVRLSRGCHHRWSEPLTI